MNLRPTALVFEDSAVVCHKDGSGMPLVPQTHVADILKVPDLVHRIVSADEPAAVVDA